MEHLIIVHEHSNEPTGEVLPRHEALAQEVWCRSTNVFVMNSQGQILCHQRSKEKERYPGAWCTHLGGHVGHDESYEVNALKELQEEAGINKTTAEIIPWRTTKIEPTRLWAMDFVVHHDAKLEELVPQPGEIDAFRWMTLEEIIDEAKKDPTMWLAGINDVRVEYYCARAALAAAEALGAIEAPKEMLNWHPIPHAV